jgi:hypothetical protein
MDITERTKPCSGKSRKDKMKQTWKIRINNMRGTNSYPKIKQNSKGLVWQALQFREEVALEGFQNARGTDS